MAGRPSVIRADRPADVRLQTRRRPGATVPNGTVRDLLAMPSDSIRWAVRPNRLDPGVGEADLHRVGGRQQPAHDLGGELPPPDLLRALTPFLTESVELVDRQGCVRWRLGPRDCILGQGDRAGASIFTHVHPDDLPRMLEFATAVLGSEPGWRGGLPTRLQHVDGTWRTYAVEVVNRLDDPTLDGIVVKTRELPAGLVDFEPNELELDDTAMAESIAEAVPIALVVLDRHGRMEYANHAARSTCDLPPGPTHGRYLPDLAVEADRSALARAVTDLLAHHGSRTVVFASRGWQGRGDLRQIEARLLARGLADRPSTIIVTLEDVTERRREEEDLRRRANYDPLTGLLNRAALLDEMEARLARGPLTAIYCDLDGFKSVNDTYGHASGDELLVEVAKLLTSVARASDAIGRLGGDEFVVVCDGLTEPHATSLVARLGETFDAGLGVRISVGVAGSPAGGSAAELLARADRAMYDDKRRLHGSGGDRPAAR
jgi:diguanylate cyclase (GGDEF)-like protein/PAS domain S-box-containing protein